MSPLCAGRPPEWWDPSDDGARLAMALCRVCVARTCDDPEPHGVIVAGVPYGNRGQTLRICVCGYPFTTAAEVMHGSCRRCTGPGTDAYRIAIQRMRADGDSPGRIGRRLGFEESTIRGALKRWAAASPASKGVAA